MATKYAYWDTENLISDYGIHGVNWESQTFTPAISHTLTSVKLRGYRVGSPGTITVSIRATSGGAPTGSDLSTGTYDGNTLGLTIAWFEIAMSSYSLIAGTVYAIVVRAPSASGGANDLLIRNDSDNGYTGGEPYYSTDSGASWAVDFYDMLFEDWGDPSFIPRIFMI